MDSNAPTLITAVPPKSSTETNGSREKSIEEFHEKSIEEEISDLKKHAVSLRKRASKEAFQKREVFFQKQKLTEQAFDTFATSANHLKQIMQIFAPQESLEELTSLCTLNRAVHSFDMSDYTPSNHSSTQPSVLTKRTNSKITKTNKKKMIRKEKPLESRSRRWSHDEKQRLRRCGKDIDASLEPAKFYAELYLRFGPTVRSDSSVRQKAVALDIKPIIWLNLNKSNN